MKCWKVLNSYYQTCDTVNAFSMLILKMEYIRPVFFFSYLISISQTKNKTKKTTVNGSIDCCSFTEANTCINFVSIKCTSPCKVSSICFYKQQGKTSVLLLLFPCLFVVQCLVSFLVLDNHLTGNERAGCFFFTAFWCHLAVSVLCLFLTVPCVHLYACLWHFLFILTLWPVV